MNEWQIILFIEKTSKYEEVFERKLVEAQQPKGWFSELKELVMFIGIVVILVLCAPTMFGCLMHQQRKLRYLANRYEMAEQGE